MRLEPKQTLLRDSSVLLDTPRQLKLIGAQLEKKSGRCSSNGAKYCSRTASECIITVKDKVFASLRIFQQMGKNRQI